jgi:hypothetical protein
MIQVSAATLYGGTSHKNPSMRCNTTLFTKYGREYELKVAERYVHALKDGKLDDFKTNISVELNEINKKMSHFLRDEDQSKKYKMDEKDSEGWKIWREMSDEYSVLNYFHKKVK